MNAASVLAVSCPGLATTGSALLALLALAGAVVIVGCFLMFVARPRRARTSSAVVLILLLSSGLAGGLVGQPSARAATSDCGRGSSLTITQTSTTTGLAPGVAPSALAGSITNTGARSVLVTSVTVSVVSVTKAAPAVAGTCDASDYVLIHPEMLVGRTIAPGASVQFVGAEIGFSDKSTIQDACKNAFLRLRYVVSSRRVNS